MLIVLLWKTLPQVRCYDVNRALSRAAKHPHNNFGARFFSCMVKDVAQIGALYMIDLCDITCKQLIALV